MHPLVLRRRAVGDLVLVYRRVTGLAGHTSRVSELLEQVQRLSDGDPQVPSSQPSSLSSVSTIMLPCSASPTGNEGLRQRQAPDDVPGNP